MKIDVKKVLPETVTIINRLKKSDSATGIEIWYKKKLTNCVWRVKEHSQQSGTTTSVGASIEVQIPRKQTTSFETYKDWKSNPDAGWTISLDDYIVLGEVSDNITAQNIVSTMVKYEPNCCKIKSISDLTLNGAVTMQGFLGMYADIYVVEGV